MSEPAPLQLLVIDVKPGSPLESQSGLQMLKPRIYGAMRAPTGARTAAILMHPTSNFMGHYLIEPLAARGIACMGLNSRYAGNDTLLLMERAIQDLGAGVRTLRAQGYDQIILIGNSGGAALCAFYQAQAESLTATRFPDGTPTHLEPEDLPPVDGIVLCAAHPGRARILRDWIDPSVTDEHDPLSRNPDLDMYDARHGGQFTDEFLARFRSAQQARIDRIEAWVLARLALLRSTPNAPADQVFIVYRTHADPRCVDLRLDPNDRAPGGVWGDARTVNYSANAMGRTTSLSAFLSQWSSRSQADGPLNLAGTSVPTLLLTYTADQSAFPSTRDVWLRAGADRIQHENIVGANHYLAGQNHLVPKVVDAIDAWLAQQLR